MYFRQFPQIYYDFPKLNSDNFLQILTDITTNVRVRKEALENVTIYDEYDIQEGETPEIIAEKVYGNPELHWVIMLVNQRYDYLADFPLTNIELNQLCIDTYGEDNLYNVHHYEKNKIICEAMASLKIPTGIYASLKVNDILTSNLSTAVAKVIGLGISNVRIDGILGNGKFLCDPTTLTAGQLITITGNNIGNGVINEYVSGNVYRISETNGSTSFKLVTQGNVAITTSQEAGAKFTGLIFSTSTVSTAQILIQKGILTAGDSVIVSGVRFNELTNVNEYHSLSTFVVGTNAFQISDVYTAITNLEFETRRNEAKRRIKLLSPVLVDQFVREFQTLVMP
jgi:hypothetical protein